MCVYVGIGDGSLTTEGMKVYGHSLNSTQGSLEWTFDISADTKFKILYYFSM